MDEKNSRYIVNGSHEARKLAELLDIFIKKFVLCSGCGNPETDMVLKKSKKGKDLDLYLSCKACGKVGLADNSHKLCSYISKNPPPGALSTPKKGDKKEKGKKKGASSEEDDDGMEPFVSFFSSISTSLHDICKNQPQTSFYFSGEENSGDIDEITTGVVDLSTKDSAVSNTPASAPAAPAEDPAETLAKFISGGDRSADDIALEASKLDLSNELAAAVMIQVLLDSNLVPQFNKHKDLLKAFTKSEKEQKGILGGLERLVAVTHPDLLPKTSQIIKLFYDKDILEEAVIIAWYDKPTKKFTGNKDLAVKVREVAKTLVEWLKNAEEESDDDE